MNRLSTLYSRPGFGKSTAAIKYLPYANCIHPPESLDPARKVLEIDDLRSFEVTLARDILACLDSIEQDNGGRYGIIIDDLSVLLGNELVEWEMSGLDHKGNVHAGDTRKMWGGFNTFVRQLIYRLQQLKEPVCITMHERPWAAEDPGRRGGPLLPSKNLTELWTAPQHEVLQFTTDDKLLTDFKGAFKVRPGDKFMVTKARCGVMGAMNPANIAEALRVSGIEVPRHPDLTWQDEVVEDITREIEKAKTLKSADLQSYVDAIVSQGIKGPHARWAVEDAYHRMLFRRGYAGGTRI
jgi:hypothetical protein